MIKNIEEEINLEKGQKIETMIDIEIEKKIEKKIEIKIEVEKEVGTKVGIVRKDLNMIKLKEINNK